VLVSGPEVDVLRVAQTLDCNDVVSTRVIGVVAPPDTVEVSVNCLAAVVLKVVFISSHWAKSPAILIGNV